MILRKKFKELLKELQNSKSREEIPSLIFPIRTKISCPSNYGVTIIRVQSSIKPSYFVYGPLYCLQLNIRKYSQSYITRASMNDKTYSNGIGHDFL
jgi:hypothetical protein